jgi:uncharacterized protein (TIGR02284 family)
MENEKAIDILNALITINNDRIEGYETATKETKEEDLKSLFAKFIKTSQNCKHQLVIEVVKLGGKIAEGTKTSGKFFRVWMEVKAALTDNDRKAILNSCEFGEDAAINSYENALKNDSGQLNSELIILVKAQHKIIKADHDKIKTMRDNLVPSL